MTQDDKILTSEGFGGPLKSRAKNSPAFAVRALVRDRSLGCDGGGIWVFKLHSGAKVEAAA